MIFVNVFVLVLVLLIITFIIIQNKNKKNIGQKISFLYNQLYVILIDGYYKDLTKKKDILKEEILDYYSNIVENNNLDNKYKYGQEVKGFIIQYYSNTKIAYLYDLCDTYYKLYYKSIKRSIVVLIFTLLILLLVVIYINLIK